MSELEKHRRHDDDLEPDVEAHKFGRGAKRNDDGSDEDQPDVEAHKFY